VIDTTSLEVAINTIASNPTRTSPIPVTVTFSKPVTDFVSTDVSVVNGAMTGGSFSGSGTGYTFTVTPSGDGLVTITIAAGVAHDTAGNGNGVSSLSITYDPTPPNTTITGQPLNPTNQTSANFTFSSTEANSAFECQIDGSAYASCTSPASYSGLASAQTHTFNVRATDQAGNNDATPAAYSWVIDTTVPTAVISAPSLAAANSTGTVTYTVTYSGADSVTLLAGNVTLNKTGTANGTVGVSGGGTITRTITISNISGRGTLGISIAANTASNIAGNQAAAAGPSATFIVNNASGDINGDGTTDMTDALLVLRIAAGLDAPTASDLASGDVAPLVNGTPQPDGKVDIGDVVAILRRAAGLTSW